MKRTGREWRAENGQIRAHDWRNSRIPIAGQQISMGAEHLVPSAGLGLIVLAVYQVVGQRPFEVVLSSGRLASAREGMSRSSPPSGDGL